MSRVIRRSAAPFLAAALAALVLVTGVAAQDASPEPRPDPVGPPAPTPTIHVLPAGTPAPGTTRQPPPGRSLPLEPSDPTRCELWQEDQAPEATRPKLALLPGLGMAAAAVDVQGAEVMCDLERQVTDDMAAGTPVLFALLGGLQAQELAALVDAPDDLIRLDGTDATGMADGALDIRGARTGQVRLDRDGARDVRRFLRSEALPEDVTAIVGRAPADWVKQGTYDVMVLDLAGDPSVPADHARYWQLGFQGGDAARTVPVAIPTASPLAGVRHLLTLVQTPDGDGGADWFLGHSDFGSQKVGADGSRYYNAPVNAAAFLADERLVFLYPHAIAPLGSRPMTYEPGSGTWDLVSAPGGPLAFLPPDGSAPGMFDLAGLILEHEPVELPAGIDGLGMSESPLPWPSNLQLIFGSTVFDPTRPVLVDLEYATGGHAVTFEDLVAEPLGDGLFRTTYGIPAYGTYALSDAVFEQAGLALPESWDQVDELIRAMGTATWIVDESAGPLHGPLPASWAADLEALPSSYDPDAARQLLEQAGWLPG